MINYEIYVFRINTAFSVRSSEESSSSSEKDVSKKIFLDSLRMIGECSKKSGMQTDSVRRVNGQAVNPTVKVMLENGLPKPKKVSFQQPNTEQVGVEVHEDIEGLEICVDLGPVEVSHSVGRRQLINQNGLTMAANGNSVFQPSSFSVTEDLSSDSAGSNEGLIQATFMDSEEELVRASAAVESEFDRVVPDSEEELVVPDSEEELVQSTTANGELGRATSAAVDSVEENAPTVISQVQEVLGVKELSIETYCHEQVYSKKGRSNSNTSSKHRMKTRSSKLQSSVSNQTLKPSQRTGELGCVEDEVTKTLEMGTALGFDFSGIEEEVKEAIVRREEEDVANFKALNGGR